MAMTRRRLRLRHDQICEPSVHTVAVGTAWGEAAMLLASGEKVSRQFGYSSTRSFLRDDPVY